MIRLDKFASNIGRSATIIANEISVVGTRRARSREEVGHSERGGGMNSFGAVAYHGRRSCRFSSSREKNSNNSSRRSNS